MFSSIFKSALHLRDEENGVAGRGDNSVGSISFAEMFHALHEAQPAKEKTPPTSATRTTTSTLKGTGGLCKRPSSAAPGPLPNVSSGGRQANRCRTGCWGWETARSSRRRRCGSGGASLRRCGATRRDAALTQLRRQHGCAFEQRSRRSGGRISSYGYYYSGGRS